MLRDAESAQGAALRDGGIMHCATAVLMWIRHMGPLYRYATIRGRRQTLESFTRDTGNMALKSIKAHHITDWLAAQNCGPASTRTLLSHLRCFFKWAVQHHHLKIDPTAAIPSVKQPRQIPRAMTADEVRALTAVLPDERAHLIVALMFDMGLRRGEVAGLDMSDVELRDGVMRITGKGGHTRLLPITQTVRSALTRYLTVRGPGAGPLIQSQIGRGGISAERVGQAMRGWLREAGVKHAAFDGKSCHALRHTCAQQMFRTGANVRVISEALGHAHISTTTDIYLRATTGLDELRAAMGKPLDDPEWSRPFPAYRTGVPVRVKLVRSA